MTCEYVELYALTCDSSMIALSQLEVKNRKLAFISKLTKAKKQKETFLLYYEERFIVQKRE